MDFHRIVLNSLYLLLLAPSAVTVGGDLIFSDGFESGDASAWSASVPLIPEAAPCPSGSAVSGVLAGDLGPAPSGPFEHITCVEIRNDQDLARSTEMAFSSLPLTRELGLFTPDDLVLVGPGGRWLAAQFTVISRWGGTVDDAAAPIRWLQVAVKPNLGALETASYALRRYTSPGIAVDALAIEVTDLGGLLSVDTGLATYRLDPTSPALFDRIEVDLDDDGTGRTLLYQHQAGAGPRLEFDPGTGPLVLDSGTPGAVVVNDFALVEEGPVRVVARLRGHFVAPAGGSLCSPPGETPYERFGFTLLATFERARRGADLQIQFRNECSDAVGISWVDDAITVDGVSWRLPFSELTNPTVYHAASAGVVASTAGFSGTTVVEQRHGAGMPWARRARATRDGAELETAEALDRPLVALADGQVLAAVSMPWMRFREPQNLAVEGETLSLGLVSEALVVGEARGLWNFARLVIEPVGGTASTRLESLRDEMTMALERGLLPRVPREQVNAAALFPSLGTDAVSAAKTHYESVMDQLHSQTVDPGGQWDRAKTFGSQLWPDVQFDQWTVDGSDPDGNDVRLNYWNPSGAELLEFLRTGDPRWGWDFALPQSWLQMYSAYINLGEQNHGNRNGVAPTSSGTGQGQWHRSGGGSDDYTYNAGLHLAYALRPSVALRDRFAQAGRMVMSRYNLPKAQEALRTQFVNQVDITRQVIQHFEILANCAEFVPGVDGAACRTRLLEVLDELARDNLGAGIFCQQDIPSTTSCDGPQRFMVSALFYHFFHRVLRNWGDVDGLIEAALVGEAVNYYQQGMSKLGDGVSIDPSGPWAALFDCNLTDGGSAVGTCTWVQIDGFDLFDHNRPHTLALLLIAHELDPTIGLCSIARQALEDPDSRMGWDPYLGNSPGWWKGSAQMMQGMVFGLGVADECSDPDLLSRH